MQTMALVTWDISKLPVRQITMANESQALKFFSKLPVRQITLTDAVFATHSFLNCLCGR